MRRRRRNEGAGVGKADTRRAVDWEIEHHLAEQTDRLVAEGWDEERARREAKRRFGYVPLQRRRIIAVDRRRNAMSRRAQWWEVLRFGVRQALRGMRRSPGPALGIVLVLGLGVGVNAAMFGVIDRLLLRPPGHVVDPSQVRRVLRQGEWLGRYTTTPALTYADIEDLRSIPQFSAVGGFTARRRYTLGAGEEARQVNAVLATADFFTALGVKPRLGRFFAQDDDTLGAAPTVVLSAEFWERSFAADGDILGHSLEISGNRYTVIGIAPRGFTGVDLTPVDVWLPAVPSRHLMDQSDRFVTSRGYYWLAAVARVAQGTSMEEAEARATALNVSARADAIARGHYDARTRIITAPLIAARGPVADNTSKVALWLSGVSLAVLLIACANVANLLLARGIQRKHEVAVRLALGAPHSRLFAARAIESLILAGLGGIGALVVAAWGGWLVQSLLIPDVLWSTSPFDARVVVVTSALSLLAALVAGLGPALRSTRAALGRDLLDGNRGGSLRRSGLRGGLTLAQATLSAVLLVGAGLFLRSLHAAGNVDLGLDTDRLVLAALEFRGTDLDEREQNRLYEEAMERVRATVAGARAVAATDNPFQSLSIAQLALPGTDSLPVPAGRGPVYYSVTPGYFETVGLQLLEGRSIQETDTEGAQRVAVVNETMERTLWPDEGALGRCFHFDEQKECTTVVGIVQDASTGALEEETFLAYYLPLAQTGFAAAGLYVRSDDDARALAAALAPVLRSFSPAVRYAEVQTLDDLLAPQTRSWMLGASLFTAFGILSLLVAAVGLGSLLAFDVAQRTRELGIRSALGARRGRLLGEVMAQGVTLVLAGTLMGIAACLVAAPYVEPLLFRVPARDPLVLATVAAVLLAAGVVASLPAALRSTHVDPATTLRAE